MILILFTITVVLIAVIFSALLLPIKLYFTASGGSDAGTALSGRFMLFNGLVGGGIKFERRSLWVLFFLGPLQIMSFKADAAVRKIRDKRKAKARQKQVKVREKEKEEEVKPPAIPLSERIEGWRLQAARYKQYSAVFFRAIRGVIRIDHCRIRLTLGFEDPSLTGKISGFIFALNSILPETFFIQPEWDFSRRVFDGEAALKLTFRNYLFWLYMVKLFFIFRKKSEDAVVLTGRTLKTQEA